MSRDIRIVLSPDELDAIKEGEIHYETVMNVNVEIAST